MVTPIMDYCVDTDHDSQNICPQIRNQNKGFCWIYSATNLASIEYRKLTNNELQFSIEQVADYFNEYFINYNCNKTDKLCIDCQDLAKQRMLNLWEGGQPACALYYMKHHGIMEEYYYPYTDGLPHKYLYDVTKMSNVVIDDLIELTPLQFNKILKHKFGLSKIPSEVTAFFKFALPFTVAFDIYDDETDLCIMRKYDPKQKRTSGHAVTAVGIYDADDGETYLKLLNSWGVFPCDTSFVKQGCFDCVNGYIYLKITENGTLINNRNWLQSTFKISVSDARSDPSNHYNKLESLIINNVYNTYTIYVIIIFVMLSICIMYIVINIIYNIISYCKNKKHVEINPKIKPYQTIDSNF
jgi:hypothetical protein